MTVLKVIGVLALVSFGALCEVRRQLIGDPWPGLGRFSRSL